MIPSLILLIALTASPKPSMVTIFPPLPGQPVVDLKPTPSTSHTSESGLPSVPTRLWARVPKTLVRLNWKSGVPTTIMTSTNLTTWMVLTNYPVGQTTAIVNINPKEPQRFYKVVATQAQAKK